jgi:hypothetical protein
VKQFEYFDLNDNHKSLIVITADSILEADAVFNSTFGVKVDKCPYISCAITKVES